MTAICRTTHPGNAALQQEIWDVPVEAAKLLLDYWKKDWPAGISKGNYWYFSLVQPYRRAVRTKAEKIRIYTAGFSTGEFANALKFASGCKIVGQIND